MKNNLKLSLILTTFLSLALLTKAQTNLKITGGNLIMQGGYLGLNNASFINNGVFQASSGTVTMSGDAIDAHSSISGSSPTAFHHLTINKTANNVQMDAPISVNNTLKIVKGKLNLQTHDLTIASGGLITGDNAESYVQTSSTGAVIQEVGATDVFFPVGNDRFTPLTLNNSSTMDNFRVRVTDAVYEQGISGSQATTDFVDATWYIDETTAGGSDVTATFRWNAADELSNFDRTQAYVSHYENGMWNNGSIQSATGADPYTLTASNITSFSPFAIASGSGVFLPFELLYFHGEQEEENVLLSWETTTEIDNSHFDIEWSENGIKFNKIGQVRAAGNSSTRNVYDFLHTSPTLGMNYYRLKQVDFGGKYEYTDIVTIEFKHSQTNIRIYPNPASDYLEIESWDLIGKKVLMFNAIGQLVMEAKHQSVLTNIPIINLPSGTYFIKIGASIKKVIIQK